MRIEWVTGAPYVCVNEGGTLVICYEKWAMLTKDERIGVLAHEDMHEQMGKRDNERMSLPDPVFDECPMCGNAETCESCGVQRPANNVVQLHMRNIIGDDISSITHTENDLLNDIEAIGGNYAALRNAVVKAVATWDATPEWQLISEMEPIMRNLKEMAEK